MTQVAAGLAQMRAGLAVPTETKLVDDRHPKTISGYSIMCSKAVSRHQVQEALDVIVKTFKCVGLATNTKKTQAMVCSPGKIRVQLPSDSYRCLREGVAAGEEGK